MKVYEHSKLDKAGLLSLVHYSTVLYQPYNTCVQK